MINEIVGYARELVLSSDYNRVMAEDALRDDLSGLQLFDEPIFGIGDAEDPLFSRLKEPEVVHPKVMLPMDWLSGARRVVSYFLPFTQEIKESNCHDFRFPSDEWLHGRIEGQSFVEFLGRQICQQLTNFGFSSVLPSIDERLTLLTPFASNWSERHAAYICGLGTFSLSKGLITEKGMAGRLGSVITDCDLPITQRPYSDIYEYCSFCMECEAHCPVKAIDASRDANLAKDHLPCKKFQDTIQAMPPRGKSQRVRFGCGKCQVSVPCQDKIPGR